MPHIQAKGCHVGGDGYLQGLVDGQRGRLLCQYTSLRCRSGGFGFDFFRLQRGWLGYGGGRGSLMSLGKGLGSRDGECDRASLRSLYRSSASDPPTAISTPLSPSASNYCASSLNKLAHCSKWSPWKRREGSVIKVRLSHKTVKEQLERLSHTKQREIPNWITPPTSSAAKAGTSCFYPWMGPVYLILLLSGDFSILTLWWLICKWDNPRLTTGIWLEDLVSRCFDLMDQL